MPQLSDVVPKLAQALQSQLEVHHSVYTLPCIGEYLEEAISKSLIESSFQNDWKPNRSHAVSKDLTLIGGPSVSIKSGTYVPDKKSLVFSGSRLGKHSTVEKMIDSVIENAADWYFCIAKNEADWKLAENNKPKKIYYLFAFESKVLPYEKCQWGTKKTKSGGSVHFADSTGFHAEIRSSMSHQLWTTVSESLIGQPYKIEIS